jgi:hypothetical protein
MALNIFSGFTEESEELLAEIDRLACEYQPGRYGLPRSSAEYFENEFKGGDEKEYKKVNQRLRDTVLKFERHIVKTIKDDCRKMHTDDNNRIADLEGRTIKESFIRIVEAEAKPKTKIWRVETNDEKRILLGHIGWFGRWRRYAFSPKSETVFEEQCLREIAQFSESETKKHREAKKSEKKV